MKSFGFVGTECECTEVEEEREKLNKKYRL